MGKINTVIWDWNGTLLNDLEICISTINILLDKRNLPLLSKKQYKEVFSFPVKDYYQAIGFDFEREDFSVPAKEFIDLYDSRVTECPLHQNVPVVLEYYKNKGFRQFVLSAMHEDMLIKTLKHNNILHYFESVAGLNDHYAVSKIERGNQLIRQFDINIKNTLLIGDTIHDFEVASELGIKCILIADGHQSAERLKGTGVKIVNGINSLVNSDFTQLFNN
jgi:phosphoglycolate phosphatase